MNTLLTAGLTHPNLDPRIAFWMAPESWPNDCKDYIFAARAIEEWGILGEGHWSDEAPTTPLPRPLPRKLDLWTPLDEIRRGVGLLSGASVSIIGGFTTADTLVRNDIANESPFPTAAEWAKAVKLSEEQWDTSWTKFLPFLKLASRLAEACRSGDVRTGTRALKGGAITEHDWQFWNTERAWQRFETCRVDLNDPFDPALGASGGAWIYIHRETFEAHKNGKAVQSGALTPEDAALKAQIKARRPSGRPPKYNWDHYAAKFSRLVLDGFVDPDRSTAEIARELLDWGSDRDSDLPDERTMQTKVALWRSHLEGSG